MSAISHYLQHIQTLLSAGNATEHTYRPALKTLLESLQPGIVATNEPKRIQCGAPDYILTRGQTPLGYVEAKDVGEPLDAVENSGQLQRYRESLANLILTDYLEFRWYVGGQPRLTAPLGAVTAGRVQTAPDGEARVTELLNAFLNAEAPTVSRPRDLAERMARIARLTRDTICRALGDEDQSGSLHQQRDGFRKTLLHDLSEEQFADMYAQTIAYGLFAARCNVPDGKDFTREHAAFDLPKTNPFLRRMFAHIAGPDLDERVVWIVDDLADLLRHAQMEAILADFGTRTRQEDPVVHFYETFLAAYDPKMREARGVYYTPEPVVSYITRSVDHLLKTKFSLPDGLADARKVKRKTAGGQTEEVHKVQILDPATGTGTFLYGVIDRIHEAFAGNKGMWSGYVRDHLLPRLYGFELLMAPYAVAHMKLSLQLAETGYDFATNERLRVYLTNTLEEALAFRGFNLFAQWVVEEVNAASSVKMDYPVMVVLGNPPYSGHSANKGDWITGLLHGKDSQTQRPTGSYFEVDGQPLGEKNPKWLNDDYVKFIRFAQWRIEQTGYGILAFISNHGYLDNPTFRGMRRSLMDTFDDIYVLDLHGNSKKKEHAPDGSKDENVFDIQQGVAIGIFVRRASSQKAENQADIRATVRHADLWGSRESKYRCLLDSDLSATNWTDLAPSSPLYLFIPQDTDLWAEYEQGWRMADVMAVNAIGINSHRDAFAVSFDANTLRQRIDDLKSNTVSDETLKQQYGLSDTSDFQLVRARQAFRQAASTYEVIVSCLYRPFDQRYLLYHPTVLDRPRPELNQHFIGRENFGLAMTRQTRELFGVLALDRVCGQHKIVATYDGSSIFPLYLYPSNAPKSGLFDESEPADAPDGRWPNLSSEFIAGFSAKIGMAFVPDGKGDRATTFGPEDVFAYMYAVFHAPSYRSRYAEFLKTDFPRLPLTGNPDLFRALCGLGDRLVALHLMQAYGPDRPSYPVEGSNVVENVRYTEPGQGAEKGCVWINSAQYFEGVAPEVWAFQVGGYQVAQKWLKDRKGRVLTYDDLAHYQRTLAALFETMRLMQAIDATIFQHGGWPLT